ncbi:PEP-CTERM sorting domain-containing protein [Catenovulum adriaticum]|uniref:PEP-CTERM sorting domain-containing protein n=1 Tax=Catenovulum adriaticum TaxID=2984846 RepID=A0ABY7AVX1_9ALTE|nr:PEP-CTERM sorting domain-containing protein [Catenovulum sp. TS8]WAJ72439.1 PEP-CTERM sorting domain-containing protein [Catenovulum sp. TS8]
MNIINLTNTTKAVSVILASLLFSFNTYAGLIMSPAQSNYSAGDSIVLDISYQFDGSETVSDISEFDFDFNFNPDTVSFEQFNLAQPYLSLVNSSDAWLEVFPDNNIGNVFGSLYYFGIDSAFTGTETYYNLFSLEFIALEEGQLNLTFNYLDIYGFSDGSTGPDIDFLDPDQFPRPDVSISVPEPSTIAFILLGLILIGFQRVKN